MNGPGNTATKASGSAANLHYRSLKERLRQSEESLPLKLRDQPDRWVLERTVAENFFLLSKHLDFMYNEFLIERTLVKQLRVSPTKLVTVSRSLLSSILILTGNRHRQGWYSNDLPWLVGSNAIISVSPEGLWGVVDCIICTSTGRSPCARAVASLTQQVAGELRLSTLRNHPEAEQSYLIDRFHRSPNEWQLYHLRPSQEDAPSDIGYGSITRTPPE